MNSNESTLAGKFTMFGIFFVVALLIAAGVSVWGMQGTKQRLSTYVEQYEALGLLTESLYSSGLQTEQAVRNIVINPSDEKAVNNYRKAMEDYDAISSKASLIAKKLDGYSSRLDSISSDWKGLAKIKDSVIQMARSGKADEAGQSLMKQGTPAWRKVKDQIISLKELVMKDMKRERQALESYSARSLTITLIVLAAMLVLVVLSGTNLVRSTLRQLGADPKEVAKVANQVAKGDFSDEVRLSAGDTTSVMASMKQMTDAVSALVHDVSEQTAAIASGRLDVKASADRHHGEFRKIVEEINACVIPVKLLADDVTNLTASAAQGQLTTRADVDSHKGDFRKIVLGVNSTLDAVIEPIAEIQHILGRMAEGDLSQRMSGYVKGDFQTLKDSLNNALSNLSSAIGAVTVNARQVAAATGQTSSAIGQIADGSQNQMHAISQVATAVKQTAASIVDVARNTDEASTKAKDSVAIVNAGRAKMEQMVDVVNNIAANSEKINKITDVIEKIANKTNLLSLNAAIEAARAGEHGRGFAVVAEEVGKLAANAAESTQEIMVLVEQAVKEANQAVATVQEVSLGMQQIADGSLQTDAMLQRISAALEQQSAAVQEVNANVNGLSKVAESNATAAEEITATVFELARIADSTRQEAERFRL